MSIRLYMDVHVRWAVTDGLRRRGVDALTAQEDAGEQLDDASLLDRARSLGRVLFSQDDDLLAEAARRQHAGAPFAGLVYAHQLRITVGQTIRDLQVMAEVYEPEDMPIAWNTCPCESIRHADGRICAAYDPPPHCRADHLPRDRNL